MWVVQRYAGHIRGWHKGLKVTADGGSWRSLSSAKAYVPADGVRLLGLSGGLRGSRNDDAVVARSLLTGSAIAAARGLQGEGFVEAFSLYVVLLKWILKRTLKVIKVKYERSFKGEVFGKNKKLINTHSLIEIT